MRWFSYMTFPARVTALLRQFPLGTNASDVVRDEFEHFAGMGESDAGDSADVIRSRASVTPGSGRRRALAEEKCSSGVRVTGLEAYPVAAIGWGQSRRVSILVVSAESMGWPPSGRNHPGSGFGDLVLSWMGVLTPRGTPALVRAVGQENPP
jgi:hypothetical protein